jgi:hypothetical protein
MTAVASQRSVIERELRAIWDDRGRLTPGDVVEAARPKDHPLHAQFEWDDEVAGAAYRTAQAAQLIRSVKIVLTTENGSIEDHKVRAWLPARYAGGDDAEAGSYVPTPEILSADQRSFMLRQLRREAAAFQRRYSHLQEYWQVLDEMSAAREETPA